MQHNQGHDFLSKSSGSNKTGDYRSIQSQKCFKKTRSHPPVLVFFSVSLWEGTVCWDHVGVMSDKPATTSDAWFSDELFKSETVIKSQQLDNDG